MDLYEVIAQVSALLQKHKRATYRALKLQFKFDDEYLEALKEELIYARRVAVDEDGKVLVWVGTVSVGETAKRGNGETAKQKESLVNGPRPIWQNGFALNRRRWRPAVLLTASARRSPRSLPTSKARLR